MRPISFVIVSVMQGRAERDVAATIHARSEARPKLDGEQPIELRRYLVALRDNWLLIVLVVVIMTGSALAVSLKLPKNYRATAKIVAEDSTDPLASTDAESMKRRLATIKALLTTPETLRRATDALPGTTVGWLQHRVETSVDGDANIINVSATARRPEAAAAIANAVANGFLAHQRHIERRRLAAAKTALLGVLTRLRSVAGASAEIDAIRQRISELSVSQASAGSELALAQSAQPPSSQSSPHPVRSTVLAFFASIFIGVIFVVGREQLVPRIGASRELSRLMGLPVLAEIPDTTRRFGPAAKLLANVEREGYETLASVLSFELPARGHQSVLIASALHGEGKTQVVAGLGRALARGGHKTLLVSADMRWPRLHERFEIESEPGLSEILAASSRDGATATDSRILTAAKPVVPDRGGGGELSVLPSGREPANPARLLSSNALGAFFDELDRLDYRYVIVDGPPLLGIVDSQILAREVDAVLIVCHLGLLRAENVIDMREQLDRLGLNVVGLVAIRRRTGPISSYLDQTAPPGEE